MISKAFNCLLVLLVAQLAVLSLGMVVEKRQGSNTISNDYPILQTSAVNGTTQVFAIPVELAQRIIGPTRRLLAPSGLPRGFLKDGDTLAYTTLLYQTDIRQRIGIDLRVPFLSTQTFAIPFVDASGDGRTPFSFEINHVSQIIPSLGATIQGHRDVLANFDPTDRAYNQDGDNSFSWRVVLGISDFGFDVELPGPESITQVFHAQFQKTERGQLSELQFQLLISSKVLRLNGLCDAPKMFFDGPDARPFFARSDIELGAVLTGEPLTRQNTETYSSTYQWAYPSLGVPCGSLSA